MYTNNERFCKAKLSADYRKSKPTRYKDLKLGFRPKFTDLLSKSESGLSDYADQYNSCIAKGNPTLKIVPDTDEHNCMVDHGQCLLDANMEGTDGNPEECRYSCKVPTHREEVRPIFFKDVGKCILEGGDPKECLENNHFQTLLNKKCFTVPLPMRQHYFCDKTDLDTTNIDSYQELYGRCIMEGRSAINNGNAEKVLKRCDFTKSDLENGKLATTYYERNPICLARMATELEKTNNNTPPEVYEKIYSDLIDCTNSVPIKEIFKDCETEYNKCLYEKMVDKYKYDWTAQPIDIEDVRKQCTSKKCKEDKPSSDSGGLSTGAIVGIVIACVVVVAVVGFFLYKRRQKKKQGVAGKAGNVAKQGQKKAKKTLKGVATAVTNLRRKGADNKK